MTSYYPTAVYALCFLASSTCAVLLGRSYWHTGKRLLLWSALCFLLLAANNLIVIVDLIVLPSQDLRVARHLFSLAAVSLLLFGFIWNGED